MSDPVQRVGRGFARLRFFVPALAVTLIAAFVEHPAVLVLLLAVQPLFLAGAVSALGYLLESDFATLALRRGSAFLVLLVVYTAFVALAVGVPLVALTKDASALNAMLLSAGVVLSVLVLWRWWPAFGLVFLWDDAYPETAGGSWIVATISRSLAFAQHLTRERDPYFGRGLPVAIALLAVVCVAMSLAGVCGMLPSELRLSALWLYAVLLCPLAHVLLAYRVEHLLLDAEQSDDDEALAPGAELEAALPQLTPADPATRKVQVLAAAAAHQIDLALALLKQGACADANPEPLDRDQRSLAIIAATCADLRLLRELIVRGVDLNRAVNGLTPLLAATRDSYQGRPDAVMTLLTNGAQPNVGDADGNTPLHYAALSCEATVAAMLLDAGADPNAVNREGHTPLGVACAAGNELLARFLLEHGAHTDSTRAIPALIAACGGAEDLPVLIKLLLKARAGLDSRDALGRSALHAAALHGHAEMLDALLAAGADIDARDLHGVTALMDAARAGSNRVLQRLVFRKPAADHTDQNGRSALVIACQSRQANDESVRLLLAVGADPEIATRDGKRAVDFAVAAGRWPLVAMIDPAYPLPHAIQMESAELTEATGTTLDRLALLERALGHQRYSIAAELVALEPALSAAELAQVYLRLAGGGDLDALRWIIGCGLPADARCADGSALSAALFALHPPAATALQCVLDTGASVGGAPLVTLLDAIVELPVAERASWQGTTLILLDRGVDACARDARGRSAAQLAAAARLPQLLGALLARGADPNAVDMRARTTLHELAALPDAEAVIAAQMLLRAGADPERAAADGQTPLGAALAAGRTQLARWLSWSTGFRHPARALRDADLPAAASVGDAAAVERLLALGLPLDGRDAQGCSALLRACGAGHAAVVANLLKRGADASVTAYTGASCLSAAVSAKRDAVVSQLLDHGVAADQLLPGGSTPLMVAAALGLTGIVKALLAHGARVATVDEQGHTALHAAAQFAFHSADTERCRQLLKLLLEAGAAVDAANVAGQTPLLLLLGARVAAATPSPQRALVELLQLLLAQGANPNAQDGRGVSCLHAAAMHGLLDAALMLVRSGADPAIRDRLGRSAHEVALMLGYADVAGELKRTALVARGSKLR